MNVLIVDDEPLACDRLVRFLQSFDYITGLRVAVNGSDALTKLTHFPADVVLLDIRMPGQDGLEVATAIGQLAEPPAVIFCTAYDDYALAAFGVQAQAYLVKPIQRQALNRALLDSKKVNKAQLAALTRSPAVATVAVYHGRERELIPLKEIYYLKAEDKHVLLQSTRGERIVDQSLKQLQQLHAATLLRIHRNMLVNINLVERIYRDPNGRYWLYLRNFDDPLSVSRRHVHQVQELFKNAPSSRH